LGLKKKAKAAKETTAKRGAKVMSPKKKWATRSSKKTATSAAPASSFAGNFGFEPAIRLQPIPLQL